MDRNTALQIIEREAGPLDSPGVQQLLQTFGTPEAVIEYWQSMGTEINQPPMMDQLNKTQEGLGKLQQFDFDKYLEGMKWGPGKMPRKKPFEGMAEMIQRAQGVGQ